MAHRTRVRFLARMRQMVIDARSRVLEAFGAIFAGKGPLARMHSNVHFQVLLQSKALSAVRTPKALHRGPALLLLFVSAH